MAATTEHYGLAVGVVTDDVIEPEHHNRIAATVDRVLGTTMKRLMAAGALCGWTLELDRTVSAGEGLIGGCWCETMAASPISNLTNGAINYVFGRTDAQSAPAGTVGFVAQLNDEKPPGAVFLGTLALDAAGPVTAANSAAPGVDRNCRRLEIGRIEGSGLVTDVPADGQFSVETTHSPTLIVPGMIDMVEASAGFEWELQETWRGDGFRLKGHNAGAETADFAYSWVRCGFAE